MLRRILIANDYLQVDIPPSMLANPSILLSDGESLNFTPKKDEKPKAAKPPPSPDNKVVSAMKEEYELYKKETAKTIK